MTTEKIKLRAGRFMVPVTVTREDNYLYFQFRFNKPLMAEIKAMEGAHWCGYDDPPAKVWRINDSPHNRFQLAYLSGANPYAQYDKSIVRHTYHRPLYGHQRLAADFVITRRRALLAAEMGCLSGDTVVTIRRGKNRTAHRITLAELYELSHHIATPIYIRTLNVGIGSVAWIRVLDVIDKGIRPTVRLNFQNREPLNATPDHEISFTYGSFIPAERLRAGDYVRTVSSTARLDFIPITRLEPSIDCHVYDVVCDAPHHHFLANDIHVHNCGKTLVSIELMEKSLATEWWYVAPRSALRAVERELETWSCGVFPRMMTYEGLTKEMKNWEPGRKAPQGVIFDESSRAKNPTAQRSQAALALANGIRQDWGDDGYILLMSGAPAPKSPPDWFMQCKIACPGFLREGSIHKFKNRLAIIVQKEGPYGQAYPHIVTWLDDEKKCKVCGELEDDHAFECDADAHPFEPSKNEVAGLYKRMSGLVLVQHKRDCLDLPDKIYRRIELPVTKRVNQILKTIIAGAKTVVSGLTLARELSDGFQYQDKAIGWEKCKVCGSIGMLKNPLYGADIPESSQPDDFNINQPETIVCDGCGGSGKTRVYSRTTQQVETPKDTALCDLLDEYGEAGRVVIYAAFTGSVDRVVDICEKNGWAWIRVDGRGWHSSLEGDPLENFQDKLEEHPRVAFIGNPGAAGMGLTLTRSPVIIYYSNSFNFEDRVQSEDRIHRLGMDTNRGATIVDLLYLPTDYLVIDNLQKKRRLQALSLGDLSACLDTKESDDGATEA